MKMNNIIKPQLDTYDQLKQYVIEQLEPFFDEPKDKPYTKEEMLEALRRILADIKDDNKATEPIKKCVYCGSEDAERTKFKVCVCKKCVVERLNMTQEEYILKTQQAQNESD